ncbi:hypothetical protein FB565_003137 [Actinoplanes lutulentus]|nr:hypothetical protein [Actinoplanes lutulentus]
MSRRPLMYAAPALLLLIFACGSGEPPRPPADPATAILVVNRSPGLPTTAEQWTLPDFTLYGDGTAVLPGETRGALLTGVRRTVTAERIAEWYRTAQRAGLFTGRTHDRAIADAGALTVRITDDAGTHETVVAGPEQDESGLRGEVIAFAETVMAGGTDAGEYRPQRYAVLVTGASDGQGPARPWPLTVPLAQINGAPSEPCQVLPPEEAEPLMPEFAGAGPDTRWESQGQRVSLMMRPLLPDEHTCADL